MNWEQVAHVVAGREKDAAWVRALLAHRMIQPARLLERIQALDAKRQPVTKQLAWVQRRIAEAGV